MLPVNTRGLFSLNIMSEGIKICELFFLKLIFMFTLTHCGIFCCSEKLTKQTEDDGWMNCLSGQRSHKVHYHFCFIAFLSSTSSLIVSLCDAFHAISSTRGLISCFPISSSYFNKYIFVEESALHKQVHRVSTCSDHPRPHRNIHESTRGH